MLSRPFHFLRRTFANGFVGILVVIVFAASIVAATANEMADSVVPALRNKSGTVNTAYPPTTVEDALTWFAQWEAEAVARRMTYPLKGRARVLGVYPVKAKEPCHLVEIQIEGSEGAFEVGDITQENPERKRSNWQVPWDERILDVKGERMIADALQIKKRPEMLKGDVRMVFFLHYVDFTRPLITPFGEASLPAPSKRPARLRKIRYEDPD